MSLRKLFGGECEFVAGAATIESIPPARLPEVAFAGRSNVGKSSLINALVGRKSLARTSQNPGQTSQLNFFVIGTKLMLVDMPGYGFAKVSKQQRELWDGLIFHYLSGRPTLRRVLLLVDARHGLKPSDEQLMKMLNEAAVPFRLVLTKADCLTQSEQVTRCKEIEKTLSRHPAALPEPLLTSTRNALGVDGLRAELAQLAGLR